MLVCDAHQYLLEHYKEFDFIWASPPCPTHSVTNNFLNAQGIIRYPDMTLYQEIILLQKFYKGIYCIENVKPYYTPLICPQYSGRHAFWANFYITEFKENRHFNICNARGSSRQKSKQYKLNLQDHFGINIEKYIGIDKRKLLRNCVDPKLGKHILDSALKNVQQKLF